MKKCATIAALLAVTVAPAFAASLEIKPGLWEITTTRMNPMTGQPTTTTEQQCMTKSEFDPLSEMGDMGECTASDEKVSANTLSVTISCAGPQGMVMNGTMVYSTKGDTMSGSTEMSMAGPYPMVMKSESQGKRLGDC